MYKILIKLQQQRHKSKSGIHTLLPKHISNIFIANHKLYSQKYDYSLIKSIQ